MLKNKILYRRLLLKTFRKVIYFNKYVINIKYKQFNNQKTYQI